MAKVRYALLSSTVLMVLPAGIGLAQSVDDPWGPLRGSTPLASEEEGPPPAPMATVVPGQSRSRAEPADPVPRAGPSASRVPAVTGSVGRASGEEDPFAPLGIRAGGYILYPSIEVNGGYTSNAAGGAGGTGAAFTTVAPEFAVRSDWAEHEATLTLRGSYRAYADDAVDDRPTGSVEATGRVDLPREWTLGLAGSYQYAPQSLSDSDYPTGVDKAPGIHTLAASARLDGDVGPLALRLGGEVGREVHESTTAGGIPVDLGDDNHTLVEGRLRAGYRTGAALTPFVEGSVFARIHDRAIDASGYDRSGSGYSLRGGLAYDGGPVTVGEVAIGYRVENRDDPALLTLEALTVDGSLVWSPTRLVTATFTAATSLNPAYDSVTPGSVIYDGSVELAYRLRHNVTLEGSAAVKAEHFVGPDTTDVTYVLGIGAVWHVNRTAAVTGRFTHEWLESDDPARRYSNDTVLVGLRLTR